MWDMALLLWRTGNAWNWRRWDGCSQEGVKNPPHERRRVLEDRFVARRSVRPTGLQGTIHPCGTQDGRHAESCVEDSGVHVHSKTSFSTSSGLCQQLYQRMRHVPICQSFLRCFYVAGNSHPIRRRWAMAVGAILVAAYGRPALRACGPLIFPIRFSDISLFA